MGLDLHVVPISAFMAGDYESGLTLALRGAGMGRVGVVRVGIGWSERLTPPNTPWGAFQRITGLWGLRRRWKIRQRRGIGFRYMSWLREAVAKRLGTSVEWVERGGSVLTRQFPWPAINALQAFALALEFPEYLGEIEGCVEDEGLRVEVSKADAILNKRADLKLRSDRFSHLVEQSVCDGFYLPCDFESPIELDDPTKAGERPPTRVVASTVRLMEELGELNERLRIKERWDTDKPGAGVGSMGDPFLEDACQGWMLMEGFARTSIEKAIPICMDG